MEERIVQIQEDLRFRSSIPDIGNGKQLFRVPAHAEDSSLYVPRRISIGPYHHGTPSCEQGQLDKERCLLSFLSRSNIPLQAQYDIIFEMVDELREMYDGLDDPWVGEDNKEAFAKMMVGDGCFLLEIMMEAMEARGYGEPRPQAVFRHSEMEIYKHDMLLLDNQIPLQVLLTIWEKSNSNSGRRIERYLMAVNMYNTKFSTGQMNEKNIIKHFHDIETVEPSTLSSNEPFGSLAVLINGFFSLSGDASRMKGVVRDDVSSSHLLGVYRWGFLGGETYTDSPVALPISCFYDAIPSATQLEDNQIGIRAGLLGHQIDVVSFNPRTGLVLQQITIDGATWSNFYSLVLYERFHQEENNHLSSYICFMHCLLKDATDSRLLRARGILNTALPDEEVIKIFNELSKNISFLSSKPMDRKIWKVGLHLRKSFNRNMKMWRKDLFQKYLRTPCALISVFVGFLVLASTIVAAIYSVLTYYKNGNH